jgi:hypothetical protein
VVMFEAQRQGRLSFYMVRPLRFLDISYIPGEEEANGGRCVGLGRRGRYKRWLCSSSDPRRRGLRPIPRNRRVPTTRIHIEELYESAIRQSQ